MKKVLIVTYYWPPAGGPGVQRWLKFVKYLPEFGVEPIVYIPENAHYPLKDPSFVEEIPENVKVYCYPIKEPYGLARIFFRKKTQRISAGIIRSKNQSLVEKCMLWIRGNFFIPDARKNWVAPSVKFLEGVIEKEGLETIITTGPPHSLHLIGLQLKKNKSLKWITDFRDPWTSIGYHKKLRLTARSKRKHKQLEREVMAQADHIITTSETTLMEFMEISETPGTVITNGYEGDYDGGVPLDSNFTLSHIGSLLSGRNPKNLWKVLSELVLENRDFDQKLRLQLAGTVSDDILESIKSYGLWDNTELLGYLSHKEALALQRRSQVLLLVEIDSEETRGILPGKLYEYMAAKRPILALGPKLWEANRIISETRSGSTFDHTDEKHLKNVILEWFKQYQENKLQTQSVGVEKYSRKQLAKRLSKLL